MSKSPQRQVPSVVNKPVPPGPSRLAAHATITTTCNALCDRDVVMPNRAVVASALEPPENLTFPVRAAAHGARACPATYCMPRRAVGWW
jgi:hypothetical protein